MENITTTLEISMAASRRNSHSVAFFAVRKYALIDEPSVGLSPSIGLKLRRDDRI
jgi:ABC-type branched-subunit amino acid transport system ATPase component